MRPEPLLAATPPMGLNTWNTFGAGINEQLIIELADALVRTGLRDAGYDYLVIDDFWQADKRDADGRLVADPSRFPSGMAALAEEIHERDLKFGIYSCAGALTCGGKPGSYGHEPIDADTFADWGADFVKYDHCHIPAGADPVTLYRRFGQALRLTGRPIVYSICEWGRNEPWTWAASVGAHLWRTTNDIVDTWASIEHIGFRQYALHPYAGPGHWNDPDMLVVGLYGKGNVAQDHHPSDTEYFTHFGLWCMLAAPLFIGCDIRQFNPLARRILMNEELIAIDQDPLGRQAARITKDARTEVWARPLTDGTWAVGLFNRGDIPRTLAVGFEALGLEREAQCRVKDCWAGEDLGRFTSAFTSPVDPHGSMILRISV